MQLIGLFDSPYVRRVAVSLHHLGIEFEHAPLSVFRDMDEFRDINPLIKAPTFVTDRSEVLMDSTLILEYVEKLASPSASLMPSDMASYQRALRLIGLAINACDKSVQIEYERKRPAEKFYQPWIDRVQAQLKAAYALIEDHAQNSESDWLMGDRLTQADITVSIAWQFTHFMVPDFIEGDRYPATAALSTKAEALPEFKRCPLEPGWTAQ